MKLIAFFVLIAMLHICTPGHSQRVTLSGKNLRLEEVFAEITKQTGYDFFYSSDLIKEAHAVTLDVNQMQVEDVLKICFEGQGLGFNIRNQTIVIFKEGSGTTPQSHSAPADSTVDIKGRVVDVNHLPIEMASVILVRTREGTETDKSGYFTLRVRKPQVTDVLDISFVGLKNKQIPLTGKTNLGQIVLEVMDKVLDESVVIAYGTTSERFRVGDVSTVKAVDIEKSPSLNVTESLSGRVPGLYVRQEGSNPGSVYTINLRGVNVIPPDFSLASGDAMRMLSKPLIVIDGLPMAPDVISATGKNFGVDAITGVSGAAGGQDPLYWLNPLDIESMTVLKDAEATALYGSRAANGVIMITTKKGKPGKTSLNITANTGINTQAKRIKLMNTEEYLEMRHEAWDNTLRAGLPVFGGINVSYTPNVFNSYDMLAWDTTHSKDWQKILLGSAPVYNVDLELSGGQRATSYRMATGYNRWGSSYPAVSGNPSFKEEKGTLSLSLSTHSLNNKLKLVVSAIGSVAASLQPAISLDNYILLAPDAPAIFDNQGKLNFADWRVASPLPTVYTGNPFFILACPYRANRFNSMGLTDFSYKFFPSLIFTVRGAVALSEGKQSLPQPAAAMDPLITGYKRSAYFGNSHSRAFNVEPNLHFIKGWKYHHLDILLGTSFQFDKQEGDIELASGYTSDEQLNSSKAATSVNSSTNILERKSVSALGRVLYRYADKFLVDLSGRRDGSSSFGPGRRYGNFGSVGLGWIFTNEKWMNNIPLLTFGKIRGSFGTTGSQSANPYAYLSTFLVMRGTTILLPNNAGFFLSGGSYQGIQSLTISRAANPTLGWAEATSLDLGTDLYFLTEQRLKFSFQWYRKITGNQLVTTNVSAVTGITSYITNSPAEVENTGIEAVIDYASKQGKSKWGWFARFNIAANRNELLSYPGLDNLPLKDNYEIGKSLFAEKLYPTFLNRAIGVFSASDSAHPIPTPYKVANYPALIGGMQAGISWKGFSLSISCTFAKQKGFVNLQGAVQAGTLGNFGASNQSVSVLENKHWQSPADINLGGGLYAASTGNLPQLDVYWSDASYIAVKNAMFCYAFSQRFLQKTGIQGLSFYARAEDLFFFSLSGYKGANPEEPGLNQQLPLRMVLVGGFTIKI